MKKKNILNLIKYHTENNDQAFRDEAYQIVKEFDEIGDYQLAEYAMGLLSSANTFTPQMSEDDLKFFEKVEYGNESLPLPEVIKDDVIGLINAIGHNVGINKYLFQGVPGTGKTETVKQIARVLERELYMVDFTMVIDSKLGQTSKNIAALFKEINNLAQPQNIVILFDEIDALALERTNSNDLREMGRATSSVLKGLDNLNEKVVLIATTNLFNFFDKALIRRFDSIIDFNRYTQEDLMEIGEIILKNYLTKFKFASRNIRLFKKILGQMDKIPYPGDLKNIIKIAIAFSNNNEEYDYLKRLYHTAVKEATYDLKVLKKQGFTLREIEILTGVSKSQVDRELKGSNNE